MRIGLSRAIFGGALLVTSVASGQSPAQYEKAIQEATQRYRGDVPERGALHDYIRERTDNDRLIRQNQRAEALKHYFDRSEIYRPYLEQIEKTPPGLERDRLIDNLRKALGETEKGP